MRRRLAMTLLPMSFFKHALRGCAASSLNQCDRLGYAKILCMLTAFLSILKMSSMLVGSSPFDLSLPAPLNDSR